MAHDANVLANVDDVIITRELERRQARRPDHAAENRALGALTAAMTESPTLVFQKLVRGGARAVRRWIRWD